MTDESLRNSVALAPRGRPFAETDQIADELRRGRAHG